ncbi:MAG: hypothetical protein IH934_01285 [Nanoarchaeota archaeon]|nr:hypothetical protein [Nanoarchaeota archaeon]
MIIIKKSNKAKNTSNANNKMPKSSGKDKLSILVLTLIFLGIVGLGIFSYYKFILPNINNIDNSILILTLAFSFLAGTVVFSAPCPCSIAILPSYMAYYITTGDKEETFGKAAGKGLIAALGMSTFFVLIAIPLFLIGAATSLQSITNSLILVVGIVFIIMGVSYFLKKDFKFGFERLSSGMVGKINSSKIKSPKVKIYLFGMAYAAGSTACTLPIFLIVILSPFILGKFAIGLFGFLAFLIGNGLSMVIVTTMTASYKDLLLNKLSIAGNTIKKISSALLIVVGIYLMYVYFWQVR